MINLATLEIAIDAKSGIAQAKNLAHTLAEVGTEATKTEGKLDRVTKKTDENGKAFGRMASLAKTGAAALAIVAVTALAATARAGDQYTQSLGKINVATGNLKTSEAVYQTLYQNALKLGTGMDTSAGAFTRFSIAAGQIHATNEQVIKLVDTVQKAGIVGGGSMEEISAATQQLGQALASGRFQGDELRSVLENMPSLALELAKNLGVNIGQLRKMGEEGKLTSDKVFKALLASTDFINKKFADMPMTMARAWGIAKVATTGLLAEIDKQIGSSKFFGNMVKNFAGAMEDMRVLVSTGNLGPYLELQLKAAFESAFNSGKSGISNVFKGVADEMKLDLKVVTSKDFWFELGATMDMIAAGYKDALNILNNADFWDGMHKTITQDIPHEFGESMKIFMGLDFWQGMETTLSGIAKEFGPWIAQSISENSEKIKMAIFGKTGSAFLFGSTESASTEQQLSDEQSANAARGLSKDRLGEMLKLGQVTKEDLQRWGINTTGETLNTQPAAPPPRKAGMPANPTPLDTTPVPIPGESYSEQAARLLQEARDKSNSILLTGNSGTENLISNPDDDKSKKELALAKKSEDELRKYHADTMNLLTNQNATYFDAFQLGMGHMVETWGSSMQQVHDLGKGIVENMATSIGGAMSAVATGAKTAKEAFADMATSIISYIIQMIIQMTIQLAIQQALGGIAGGMQMAFNAVPKAVSMAGQTGASYSGGSGASFSAPQSVSQSEIDYANTPMKTTKSVRMLGQREHEPMHEPVNDWSNQLAKSASERLRARESGNSPHGEKQKIQTTVNIVTVSNPNEVPEKIAQDPDMIVHAVSKRIGPIRRLINQDKSNGGK